MRYITGYVRNASPSSSQFACIAEDWKSQSILQVSIRFWGSCLRKPTLPQKRHHEWELTSKQTPLGIIKAKPRKQTKEMYPRTEAKAHISSCADIPSEYFLLKDLVLSYSQLLYRSTLGYGGGEIIKWTQATAFAPCVDAVQPNSSALAPILRPSSVRSVLKRIPARHPWRDIPFGICLSYPTTRTRGLWRDWQR